MTYYGKTWQTTKRTGASWRIERVIDFNKEELNIIVKDSIYKTMDVLGDRYQATDMMLIFYNINYFDESLTLPSFEYSHNKDSKRLEVWLRNKPMIDVKLTINKLSNSLFTHNSKGLLFWVTIYGNTIIFDYDKNNIIIERWETRHKDDWSYRILYFDFYINEKKNTYVISIQTDSSIWIQKFGDYNNVELAKLNTPYLESILKKLEQEFKAEIRIIGSECVKQEEMTKYGFTI